MSNEVHEASFDRAVQLQWKALRETFEHHEQFMDCSYVWLTIDANHSVKWDYMVQQHKFTWYSRKTNSCVKLDEGWVRAAASLPMRVLAEVVVPETHGFLTTSMLKWCIYVFVKKLQCSVKDIVDVVWPKKLVFLKREAQGEAQCGAQSEAQGAHILHELEFAQDLEHENSLFNVLFKYEPHMYVLLNMIFEQKLFEFPRQKKMEALEVMASPSPPPPSPPGESEPVSLRTSSVCIPPPSPTKGNIRAILKMTSVFQSERQWCMFEKAMFAKRHLEARDDTGRFVRNEVCLHCDTEEEMHELQQLFIDLEHFCIRKVMDGDQYILVIEKCN